MKASLSKPLTSIGCSSKQKAILSECLPFSSAEYPQKLRNECFLEWDQSLWHTNLLHLEGSSTKVYSPLRNALPLKKLEASTARLFFFWLFETAVFLFPLHSHAFIHHSANSSLLRVSHVWATISKCMAWVKATSSNPLGAHILVRRHMKRVGRQIK